jgi:methenyltetrahydromethanopterin cyclohydrolase
MTSVNKNAMPIIREMLSRKDMLQVRVEKRPEGATLIDAGVAVLGGYTAGLMATRICMAGLCGVSLSSRTYGDFDLPTIGVATDQPAISTLASQFAGWEIKVGDYFGMGSRR